MRMEAILQMSQKMQLKLAPQIIQSIEILQLPLLALRNRLDQELVENPMLEREEAEVEEDEEEEAPEPVVESPADEIVEVVEAKSAEEGEDFDKFSDFNDYYAEFDSGGVGKSFSGGEKDSKLEALENSPEPQISLEEHLRAQLAYFDITEKTRQICENIIANLDSRGYLAYPLEEIVSSMDIEVSEQEAEEALKVVQQLEPPGVGARSLEECLLLQLDSRHENSEFMRKLIQEHFQEILENKYPKVANEMGCAMEELKAAVEEISKLNPMPGSLFGESAAPYVVPDLRVELIDGEYKVFLEDSWLPPLRLNSYYLDKLRRGDLDSETREFVKKKVQAARWLIDAIEQRRTTLFNVATEILKVQKEFLEKGDAYLKPLKMQDIADRAGVHVSTVSRAISDKYIQTPRGIYSLKHFFTGGLQKQSGEVTSWETVRQKLLEIVRNEDKRNPLSDEQISAELSKQGINIARRTVSKYRKNLNIPSAKQRKEY